MKVRLIRPLEGRRNFKGRLRAVPNAPLVIEGDDQRWELDYEDIDEARLVPDYQAP